MIMITIVKMIASAIVIMIMNVIMIMIMIMIQIYLFDNISNKDLITLLFLIIHYYFHILTHNIVGIKYFML